MGKLYVFQRRIAAFLIVAMISTNIFGNVAMASGIPEAPLTGGRIYGETYTDTGTGSDGYPLTGGDRTDVSTGSNTGSPETVPGAGAEETLVSVFATVTCLETGEGTIDKESFKMRLYRNGKPYYGSSVKAVKKTSSVDVEAAAESTEDDEAADEEKELIWDLEGQQPDSNTDTGVSDHQAGTSDHQIGTPSNAVQVTSWQYQTEPLPQTDAEGNHYVYTLRPVTSGNAVYAVLYQNEEGEYADAEQAKETEEISEYICIPYQKLSGTYRVTDPDGMELERLPEWAVSYWEESPLELLWDTSEHTYPELLEKQVEAELTLTDDGTAGTWSVEHALLVDPASEELFELAVTLENNEEHFAAVYHNDAAHDGEEAAYDGAVIENMLQTDEAEAASYIAKVRLNWDDDGSTERPEISSFLHAVDETGAELTVTVDEAQSDETGTMVSVEGLNPEGSYRLYADPVANYRGEQRELELVGIPVKLEVQPDAESDAEPETEAQIPEASAVTPHQELTFTQLKDITGTIFWNDRQNKLGIRPSVNFLSGLVSDAPEVQVTEDIISHVSEEDCEEPSAIWVQQEDDTWMFAITNVEWDDSLLEPGDITGYTFRNSMGMARFARTGGDVPVMLEGELETYDVKIEQNIHDDENSLESDAGITYVVTYAVTSEELLHPATCTIFTLNESGTETVTEENREITDGKIYLKKGEHARIKVPTGVTGTVAVSDSPALSYLVAYSSGSQSFAKNATDSTEVTFSYSVKVPSFLVQVLWNDNNDEHGNRPAREGQEGQPGYESYLQLHFKIDGEENAGTGQTGSNYSDLGLSGMPSFVLMQDISVDSSWIYQIENTLPVYTASGDRITYTATLAKHPGYITEPIPNSGTANVDVAFRNTHIYTFPAEIEWKDAADTTENKESRPDEVLVKGNFTLWRTAGKITDGHAPKPESVEISLDRIRIDKTNGNYQLSVEGLPEYDETGNPYTYWLQQKVTESGTALLKPNSEEWTDGVYYSWKAENFGNHSDETEKIYQDGKLIYTLTGDTLMSFTKEWRDGAQTDKTARPGGSFDLRRYPKSSDLNAWKNASPVPGYTSLELVKDKNIIVYNIGKREGTETAAEDSAESSNVVNCELELPRFDESGQEYIYIAREKLTPVEESNFSYASSIWKNGQKTPLSEDGCIMNGDTICNTLTGNTDKEIVKKWDASAYQKLNASVLLRVTREKRKLTADGEPEVPEAWMDDTEFNDVQEEQKPIELGRFIAEQTERSCSLADLNYPKYDDYGYEFRYSAREIAVDDYSQAGENGLPQRINLSDGKTEYQMDGHTFLIEPSDSEDGRTTTIINRLIDETDIKVKKAWSGPLEAETLRNALQEADIEQATVVLQVNRAENESLSEPIGRVQFTYRIDASGQIQVEACTLDKNGTSFSSEDTAASDISGGVQNTRETQNTSLRDSSVVVKAFGGEKLQKYAPSGAEYRYTVSEVSVTPDRLGGKSYSYYPGKEDTYSFEARTGEELNLFGEKRNVGIVTNHEPGVGEWIEVQKVWKDAAAGDDIRGTVVVALQIFDANSKEWKFVKNPVDGNYTATTGNPEEYYTLNLNGENNWKGHFKISDTNRTAAYYNQFRVLEISAGSAPLGYTYVPYGSKDKRTGAAADTEDTKWIPEKLDEYYGADLSDGTYQPKGILKSGEHFYKVETTGHTNQSGVRTSYTLCNRQIGMLTVEYEKIWKDNYVAEHPDIVFELSREGDGTKDYFEAEFPRRATLSDADKGKHEYHGRFENLPKYDPDGNLYKYDLNEVLVDTEKITDGKVTVIVSVKQPVSVEKPKKESVTYKITKAQGEYVVGSQHTSDTVKYTITNTLEDTLTNYTVHKIWKDDRTSQRENMRPDLYLTLWRTKWANIDGTWTKGTPEPVQKYIDRKWETKTGTSNGTSWHWTCTFDDLDKFDESGNLYVYTAEENMHTNVSEYQTYYFREGVLNDNNDIADLKAALANDSFRLNNGQTLEEAGKTDNKSAYEFAPNNGVIVNVPRDTVYKNGKKVFSLGDLELDNDDMPSITLELRWRPQPTTEAGASVLYRKVEGTATDRPLIDAEYLNQFQLSETVTPDMVATVTLNTSERTDYTFGQFTDKNNKIVNILPKYDSEGHTVQYAVCEVKINGKDIYDSNDATLIDGFEWITNSTEFNLNNVLSENGSVNYSVGKRWSDRPVGYSGDYPAVQVNLHRVMTGVDENNRPVLLLYSATKRDKPVKRATIITDTNDEGTVTFSDLPEYGPNGKPWFYWVTEDKVHGYSSENSVDDAIRNYTGAVNGKLSMSEVEDFWTTDGEGADVDGNHTFTNTYESMNPDDYVTIAGVKTWSKDSEVNGEPRWDRNEISFKLYRGVGENATLEEAEEVDSSVASIEWDEDPNSLKFAVDYKTDSNGEVPDSLKDIKGLHKYAPNGQPYKYFVEEYYKTGGEDKKVPVSSSENTDGFEYTFNSSTAMGNPAVSDSLPEKLMFQTVENTLETVNLTVTKEWEGDFNDYYKTRPDKLLVTVERKLVNQPEMDWSLYNIPNSQTGKSEPLRIELSAANSWTSTVNLPKYDPSGAKYQYRAVEKDIPNGYTKTSEKHSAADGKAAESYSSTITNTLFTRNTGSTSIRAVKIWSDNDDRDGFRDESAVTFKLYRKATGSDAGTGECIASYSLSQEASADGTITTGLDGEGHKYIQWNNLPRYMPSKSNEGKSVEAEYSVVETMSGLTGAQYGTVNYAKSTIAESGSNIDVWTVTNIHDTINNISVKFIKEWDDVGNAWGTRPENITVTLMQKVLEGDNVILDAPATYGNGTLVEPVTLNGQLAVPGNLNQWEYTFENLPYAGKIGSKNYVYTYYVKEELTQPIVYTPDNTYNEPFEPKVDADEAKNELEGTVKIKNTFKTTSIKAKKIWSDTNSGYDAKVRPESVTFALFRRLKNTTPESEYEQATNANAAQKTLQNTDFKEEEQTIEYPNLPLYDVNGNMYEYQIREINMQVQDSDIPVTPTIKDGKTTLGGYEIQYGALNDANEMTITNQIETGSLTLTKIWDDRGDQDGLRNNIKINLYRLTSDKDTNKVLMEEKDMTAGNADMNSPDTWSVQWDNLPVYAPDGNPYYYQAEEVGVPNDYTTSWTPALTENGSSNVSGTVTLAGERHEAAIVLTNSHTPKTMTIHVEKEWKNNDLYPGKDDAKVTLTLYQKGADETNWSPYGIDPQKIAEKTDNPDTCWKVSWEGLPVRKAGKDIAYKVEEATMSDYETSYAVKTSETPMSGSDEPVEVNGDINNESKNTQTIVVTNTLKPMETSATVKKVWDDAHGGQIPEQVTAATFELQRRYRIENGVSEGADNPWQPVPGGELGSTEPADQPYTVTLSHSHNQTEAHEVDYTVKSLPVYDVTSADGSKGRRYEYRFVEKSIWVKTGEAVTEVDVQPETEPQDPNNPNASDTENLLKGVVGNYRYETVVQVVDNPETDNPDEQFLTAVTNTWMTRSFYGQKVWDDGGNRDGLRGPITLDLYADDTRLEGKSQTITPKQDGSSAGSNVNSVQWDNLPVNTLSGKPIDYSVKESRILDGYGISVDETTDSGKTKENPMTVTNTHTPETTGYQVKKYWIGDEDWQDDRPESIQVELWMRVKDPVNGDILMEEQRVEKDADGKRLQPVTLTSNTDPEKDWTGKWENLYRNENIKGTYAIEYFARELGADGYILTASGSNAIINTLKTTGLKVEKHWDDADDSYGLRPESITIQLQRKASDEAGWTTLPDTRERLTMTADNSWQTVEFTGLPTHNSRNKLYTYRAVEVKIGETPVVGRRLAVTGGGTESVPGGSAAGYQVSYQDKAGKTSITNRLLTGSLEVGKTLKGGSSTDFEFRVELTVNGHIFERDITVRSGEHVRIDGIPAGASYEVTELEKTGYRLEEKTGDTGVIAEHGTAKAEFVNRKKSSGGGGGGGSTGGGSDPGHGPGVPVGPTQPTDPTKPGNPTQPTDPTKPVDPTQPTDPTKPGDPTQLTDPMQPAGTTQPDKPGNTDYPGIPSGTPEIPTNPNRIPEISQGTMVTVRDPKHPDDPPLYYGPYDPDQGFKELLPPGEYLLITIGENGTPLGMLYVQIDEDGIPMALPKTGDRSGRLPMELLAVIFAGSAAGAAVLTRRKREDEPESNQ